MTAPARIPSVMEWTKGYRGSTTTVVENGWNEVTAPQIFANVVRDGELLLVTGFHNRSEFQFQFQFEGSARSVASEWKTFSTLVAFERTASPSALYCPIPRPVYPVSGTYHSSRTVIPRPLSVLQEYMDCDHTCGLYKGVLNQNTSVALKGLQHIGRSVDMRPVARAAVPHNLPVNLNFPILKVSYDPAIGEAIQSRGRSGSWSDVVTNVRGRQDVF